MRGTAVRAQLPGRGHGLPTSTCLRPQQRGRRAVAPLDGRHRPSRRWRPVPLEPRRRAVRARHALARALDPPRRTHSISCTCRSAAGPTTGCGSSASGPPPRGTQGGSRRHQLQWTAAPPLHRQAARPLHKASAWTACPASCGRESDGLGRRRRVDTQLATRGPPRPAPAATPCMRTGACHAFCFTGPLHPERKVGPTLYVAVRSWSRELLVERECGQRVRAVQGTTQFHSPTASTERAPGTAVTSRRRPCGSLSSALGPSHAGLFSTVFSDLKTQPMRCLCGGGR